MQNANVHIQRALKSKENKLAISCTQSHSDVKMLIKQRACSKVRILTANTGR